MPTILVTGCSSGYGRATALHFHDHGWNVIATMRTPARDLPASPRLRVLALDVTDPASVTAAIGDATGLAGGLDAIVNNAGIGLMAAFEATSDDHIRALFATNVFGLMAVTRAVIPHFRERRAGTIVNVTSSVGILPMPLVAAYAASKYAVEGFTESLGYELATFGARAKIVEPGYGPGTRFTANNPLDAALLPEPYAAYAQQLMGNLAGGKTTDADDVARAVFLAVTDGTDRLRYAAGADAEDLAAMRSALPGEAYLAQARAWMSPKA
jgi:NAD(P)-dependent dehydrogenase (short-subunit alcohol dehydrogenase family)